MLSIYCPTCERWSSEESPGEICRHLESSFLLPEAYAGSGELRYLHKLWDKATYLQKQSQRDALRILLHKVSLGDDSAFIEKAQVQRWVAKMIEDLEKE